MRLYNFFVQRMIHLILLVSLGVSLNADAGNLPEIIYTSPVNNAQFVNPDESIILAFGAEATSYISKLSFSVTGSMSGVAGCKLTIADDGRTVILKPDRLFAAGEEIKVTVSFKSNGTLLRSFRFFTDNSRPDKRTRETILNDIRSKEFGNNYGKTEITGRNYGDLPSGWPQVTISINKNPAPGTIFFANFQNNPHIAALKSTGEYLFVREMPSPCYDFRLQENGLLTYFQNQGQVYFGMDSSYSVTDTFYTVNGYDTDLHELRILSNGNYVLMSYDVRIVDMSKIIPGGQKNAQVTGLIIQEIDSKRNAVFQWRSWDHFEITDADSVNLTLGVIDYCHGNAIEIDYDGNFLLSSRNMSEITKISRATGDLIYRLGGKNNQFTFLNDTIRFSYQHAIRRTSAGTYTLFDNGNFHIPKVSRAVEYAINESARTCTRVWEFRNDPLIYSFAMGFAERLPNGNTSISWGFNGTTYTEVTPSGEKAFEFSLENLNYSYRVVKEPWSVKPLKVFDPPEDHEVISNYPNPFNGSTVIYFNILRQSQVTLDVFDVLGRKVRTLLSNELRHAGPHSVSFSADGLNSGLYFYVLNFGQTKSIGKMVLVK